MQILAINGSPRGRNSNTDCLLQSFLAGAIQTGAQIETIYTTELVVNDCLGCFSCWKKTPGQCILQDDMNGILDKMRKADTIVWATPLYHYGMTARLKRIMERTLPLVKPYMVKINDHYKHPPRYSDVAAEVVVISNCGFPERHHFTALIEQFKLFDNKPAATILCAGGELLAQPDLKDELSWYLDAMESAGREFAQFGKISEETNASLTKNLMPTESFVAMANASWQLDGERAPTLAEAMAGGEYTVYSATTEERSEPLTSPQTLETARDFIAGMPLHFQPQVAGDLSAIIAFDMTGSNPGKYFLRISNGSCHAFIGEPSQSDLTIHAPSDVWVSICNGELSGQKAIMEGKYYIDGDIQLLIQFNNIFSHVAAGSSEQSALRHDDQPMPEHSHDKKISTASDFIQEMVLQFRPAVANGIESVLQFCFCGVSSDYAYLIIKDNCCTSQKGRADKPTTTITVSLADWLAIGRGDLDGVSAMTDGRLLVTGDFSIMMKLQELFPKSDAIDSIKRIPNGPLNISGMAWLTISFIPWIIFWIARPSGAYSPVITGASLILSLAIMLYRHQFIRLTWMDRGTVAFFTAALGVSLVFPSFLDVYGSVLSNIFLAGVWMGTLATDEPLTTEYSRWSYNDAIVKSSLFCKINMIITAFWGGIDLLQSITNLIGIAYPGSSLLWISVTYALLIPAFWFTGWFPKWYPAFVARGGIKRLKPDF